MWTRRRRIADPEAKAILSCGLTRSRISRNASREQNRIDLDNTTATNGEVSGTPMSQPGPANASQTISTKWRTASGRLRLRRSQMTFSTTQSGSPLCVIFRNGICSAQKAALPSPSRGIADCILRYGDAVAGDPMCCRVICPWRSIKVGDQHFSLPSFFFTSSDANLDFLYTCCRPRYCPSRGFYCRGHAVAGNA